MNAGRELDTLVAEKIFGWAWERDGQEGLFVPPPGDPRRVWAAEWDERGRPDFLPCYSTDIAAAWTVAERFDDYYNFVIARNRGQWHASLIALPDSDEAIAQASADSAALAICLAALKALGLSVEIAR